MFFKKKNIEIISDTYNLLQKKYKKKQNIQLFLKKKRFKHNEIIKLAYDSQSGSYLNFFNKLKKEKKNRIYHPLVNVINKEFKNVKSILDFGCGELTTSSYIFKHLKHKIKNYFANDISFNRLLVGSIDLKKKLSRNNFEKFKIFCNSDYHLPFKNNSIDLIITIHALEPNNRTKLKIIDELLRISRQGVVMMEPHYEIADVIQKNRMKKFGYIRGIEKIFKQKKINFKILKKKFHLNNKNKSSIFILKKKIKKNLNQNYYVEPLYKTKLIKYKNILYSEKTCRVFPTISDITLFNEDSQIFLPKIRFK